MREEDREGLETPFSKEEFREVLGELIGDKALCLMAFPWLFGKAIGDIVQSKVMDFML